MIDVSGIHALLERAAEKTRPSALSRLGMSPAQVRAALERARPLTPEETRRAAARAVRKQSVGRKGLPAYVVDAMYADYQRLQSLSKVAKLYGRTRQAMWQILSSHGRALQQRNFHAKVVHNGRTYTPGKDGYLRATSGDRRQLHYVIWEEARGPVTQGHSLAFRNGNRHDVRLDNLLCAPMAEITRLHAHGQNQHTKRTTNSRQDRVTTGVSQAKP